MTAAELRGVEEQIAENRGALEKDRKRVAKELDEARRRRDAGVRNGLSGPALDALNREVEDTERQLAELDRDLALTQTAVKAAAEQREVAAVAEKWVTVDAEMAAARRGIEQAVRTVPPTWATYESAFARARAFEAELQQFKRRHPNVTVAAPPASDTALTADLLRLAQAAGPALLVLDQLRQERRTPPPKAEVVTPGHLVAGDGRQGRQAREALAAVKKSEPRSHY